jgi:hypothetical protein
MTKIIIALFAAVILASCLTLSNNESKLKLGMSKEEAIAALGETPVEGEIYCSENILFFYEWPIWFDGSITADECLPLVFEDGKLIGWDKEFYQSHRKKNW